MGNSPSTPTPSNDDLDDDETEAVSPVASARIDPLHALLNMDVDKAEDLTDTFDVPLKDGTVVSWTIGMVEQPDIEAIRDKCMSWVRKPGARRERIQELDQARMNRELIVAATRTPDLTSKMLVAKFPGTRTPADLLNKFLKPGTIAKLGDQVLDFSGFDDEELVAEGKG